MKNTVTSGINSLYTARKGGVSATEFKCATTPQMRPTRSVMSVSCSTVLPQVMSACAFTPAIASRASAIAACMAGLMSAVVISS